MDYIKIPRSLIYKDRTDLKDFGVQILGTMNNYLFTQMRKLTLLHCGNAKEIALQCFNNAYYICTLIQLEEFPDLCMDKYEEKLLEVKIPFPEDVYQASMALVCVLLAAYDDKYKQKDNLLIQSIHHWTSSNKWTNSNYCKSFEDIINTCSTDSFILPQSEFAPRSIIDAIENISTNELAIGVIYLCKKLALLENQRKRIYGADLAIARLNDDLREIYEEWGYDPKTKRFDSEKENPLGDIQDMHFFSQVTKLKEKAVEYIVDNYPSQMKDAGEPSVNTAQKSETEIPVATTREHESMRKSFEEQLTRANNTIDKKTACIKKLESDVRSLEENLRQAEEKIKEFMQPVEELTADQKVRMAFALQLLRAAGLSEDTLKQNKSKVAKLIHLLTYIGANNTGNYPPTQICQNWLVDKHYYPKRNATIITEINTLCGGLKLDTKSFLDLG